MTESKKEFKTGTTTIGIVCKDGIVLAADKRVTMGYFIAGKDFDKIVKITDQLALTIAGSVADAQMLTKYLIAEMELYRLTKDEMPNLEVASNLLANIVFPRAKSFAPYLLATIMGGIKADGTYGLRQVYSDGSNTEDDKFISVGSGQMMAYGVLETEYKKDLSVKDGVDLATKAINAAIQRDGGSGDGIDIVILDKKGFSKIKKVIKQKLE